MIPEYSNTKIATLLNIINWRLKVTALTNKFKVIFSILTWIMLIRTRTQNLPILLFFTFRKIKANLPLKRAGPGAESIQDKTPPLLRGGGGGWLLSYTSTHRVSTVALTICLDQGEICSIKWSTSNINEGRICSVYTPC